MPVYYEPDVPVNNEESEFAVNVVNCLLCSVNVRNTDYARNLHIAFHTKTVSSATTGSAANPATIGVGATADIVVPLTKAMPTATYAASPMLLAATGTLLGAVSIVTIVTQTATSVTVRVKNGGLSILSAGSVVIGVIGVG